MTMLTKWGAALDRSCPLPEYPRPQLRRESFYNLNGVWNYAVTPSGDEPVVWDGEIVVPFSPEAPLSALRAARQRTNTSITAAASLCRRDFKNRACCCISARWIRSRRCS